MCYRPGCGQPAVATMTYNYQEATAVVGPLSPSPVKGAFDLCQTHATAVTVPHGWQLIRLATQFEPAPPSEEDLYALADAIRGAARRPRPPRNVAYLPSGEDRRTHESASTHEHRQQNKNVKE